MNDHTNAGPVLPELPTHPERYGHWHWREEHSIRAYGLQCWNACAEHARAPLLDQLGQCFRLSGADPDGNENWRLAHRAVDAVRQLRADYEEACDENDRLLARIAELEAQNQTLTRECSDAEDEAGRLEEELQKEHDEIDRLRAEVEAKAGKIQSLRDSLAECADDLETEVNARASGEVPRRIERDLEPVRKARALLAQPAGSWVNPLAAEVEALTEAGASLRADAERYQYLRDQCRNTDPDRMYFSVSRNIGHDWECVDKLDDAIDAARKGEGSEGAAQAKEGAE